jgi:amidase
VRRVEPGDSVIVEMLSVQDGIIHFIDEIRFPVRPMVGVVGVATESEEITNAMPGKQGGNLDDHLHGI